jgi:beta-galactosidase
MTTNNKNFECVDSDISTLQLICLLNLKNLVLLVFLVFSLSVTAIADDGRTTINLNGTWQFDQTLNAFPPAKFTRTIPVPGVIHLAEPKIDDYNKILKRLDKVYFKENHNLYDISYTPRYNWYKKTVFIPSELEGQEGVITIKKSQYVTQLYVNGMDMGTNIACFTPIEFNISRALKYGAENEILIKVGDRVWLPSESPGHTDKEKENYIPGIWDDVFLSFTGKMRVNRLLVLPSVENKRITVKAQVRSFLPAQIFANDPMQDKITVKVSVCEKISGKEVATTSGDYIVRRDNLTVVEMSLPLTGFITWSPEKPFLYTAKVSLTDKTGVSDEISKQFGMRDFTRRGKFFYLNGEQYFLRGTNITLQRFFEDPDCGNLVWDRNWVKKFLIDNPKKLNWNAMRICIGLVPDFWYDLADEYGILFQNEWFYWQNHGWDDQTRKEYTDWVWSDGCHPSIAIWDGINENWDNFIGNTLIPELKKLDPTRIWDTGFMTSDEMSADEMDEPHLYAGPVPWALDEFEKNPYPLGDFDFRHPITRKLEGSSSPQLVNEYGCVWLWRNGSPTKLTIDFFKYYLGANSTPEQNRELQAYWLQLETEFLRSNTNVAGVLALCYLANNYGYTGDWFIDNVRDLKPAPALNWFRHCFAPAALFINLADGRYVKHLEPRRPGSELFFNLAGVNNFSTQVNGKARIYLLDSKGKNVGERKIEAKLSPLTRTNIPISILLPDQPGGYVLVAEFTPENGQPVISRRFLKVGQAKNYSYCNLNP